MSIPYLFNSRPWGHHNYGVCISLLQTLFQTSSRKERQGTGERARLKVEVCSLWKAGMKLQQPRVPISALDMTL